MKARLKLIGAVVATRAACRAVTVMPLVLASASAVLVGGAIVKCGIVTITAPPAAAAAADDMFAHFAPSSLTLETSA